MGLVKRGRGIGLLLAGCLLAAGCTTTGDAGSTPLASGTVPARPAPVRGPAITGTVELPDGAPAAGATVVVAVDQSASEDLVKGGFAVLTLGVSCLLGCRAPTAQTLVARNGAFAVAVPTGAVSDRDAFTITAAAGRGGGSKVATSMVLAARVRRGADVGAIPLAADGGVLDVSGVSGRYVPPPVPGAGGPAQVTLSGVEADLDAGGQLVPDGFSTTVRGSFDLRVLEEGRAEIDAVEPGTVGGRRAVFSASTIVVGHLVPPSRGAACYVEGSRGQAVAQHPCGLTNGQLYQDYWPLHDDPRCDDGGACPGRRQSQVRDVTVVLAHPVESDLVVVRGCGPFCSVGVSTDGTTFGSWRTSHQDGVETIFVDSLPARPILAVRVRTAPGGFFESLAQVSVWGVAHP